MKTLQLFKLVNEQGSVLSVTNFGATITRLTVPDRKGHFINVIVGLEQVQDYNTTIYHKAQLCLGATMGRYAGRISKGGFNIDQNHYALSNENGIHLHGGKEGFDQKYWTVIEINHQKDPFIRLGYISNDLEEGYPGKLSVEVCYQLMEDNTLKVNYKAIADKKTHVNLTNHAYFNLNGQGNILDHQAMINSRDLIEFDANLIPSGNIVSTEKTRFDFTKTRTIGSENFKGLDHAFVLDEGLPNAILYAPETGIRMEMNTNQPSVVVYTPPKFADLNFNSNAVYTYYPAICFEAQHFPDTPNQPNFPSTLLKPGEVYLNKTDYKFTIRN